MLRYEHGGDIYGNSEIRLDFSENTNFLGLPPAGQQAIVENMPAYSQYPDPHCRALRQRIADFHGITPGQILCGNGAADLIFRLCAWKKPRLALTMAPTFSEYERPIKLFGGQVQELLLSEQEGFAVPDTLPERIPGGTELVVLCNPNNPTGRLISLHLIERVAECCRELGALLLLDECFLPFTDGASALPLLEQYPNLLILRAFTKLYAMAGLRLGYLLGQEELLRQIRPFGAEWSVSVPAQKVGMAVLGQEPEWSRSTREATRQQREYMTTELTGLGVKVYPSSANFLLLHTPKPLAQKLKELGILVRDCSNYTGLNPYYIRIGLKDREKNLELLRCISEVL